MEINGNQCIFIEEQEENFAAIFGIYLNAQSVSCSFLFIEIHSYMILIRIINICSMLKGFKKSSQYYNYRNDNYQ